LPPGGQDNGVWATMWVLIAELESREVAPVLARMADIEVGAYAATDVGSGRVSTGGVSPLDPLMALPHVPAPRPFCE
jgi:hypothetical protein